MLFQQINKINVYYPMKRPPFTLHFANKLFSRLHTTINLPWNTQLRELAKNGHYTQSLKLYLQMLRFGASPNAFTFPFALKSCAALSLTITGKQLHSHVLKSGCLFEPFVQTALISMYCKYALVESALQVFDESPQTKTLTVCYNALIAGYTKNCQFGSGFLMFSRMRLAGVSVSSVTMLGLIPGCTDPSYLRFGMSLHCLNVKVGLDNDLSVGNCLLTMYVRCESIELARKLFDDMPDKELITWNAMISGYAQNGLASEVLDLYHEMEVRGICSDPVTFVGVLSSCANLGAQKVGQEIEKKIKCSGFESNTYLKNALVNMYARCGNLSKARAIFDGMVEKNLVSWTAIIGGYGMHGQGEIAVQLFDEMIKSGIRPDRMVFVCVLSACSHAGLTDMGLNYFSVMKKIYGLMPGNEHYSCIVDLLGRAGRLEEARKLIDSMSVKPDGAVWGALLGACKIHKNVELAELAFNQVIELEPTNIGYYVLLSNIYSDVNDLDGILKIRVMMKRRNLRKDPGYSYVEHKGKTHLFVAGDKTHSQRGEIYAMLDKLEDLVTESSELKKNEDERRDINGMAHSERLAISFALLSTGIGMEILVIKNLRVCGDCHLFIKLVSKLVNRQFVVRDATRFHHFKDGVCSCKDYW